jgi:putative ABC transport system ATP-binding protein
MAPLIELKNVTRCYDAGRTVGLAGVNLRIDAGETVAVIGPSGSGKSTLANMICGLDSPNAGEVWFDARPVRNAAAWCALRGSRIGIVFQHFHLLGMLTAAENIEAALVPAGIAAMTRRDAARQLLEAVGLAHHAARLPADMSGGERQRVAIARAIAGGRDVLVCDEPTGSLDQVSSLRMIELLADICRIAPKTVILITHNPAVAEFCRRKIEIVDGQIVNDTRRIIAA